MEPETLVNPADVATVDAIIGALYEVVSGPAGGRDWNRMRSLFAADGRLIPRNLDAPGGYRALDVDGYIASSGEFFKTNGFFEREIHRQTVRHGDIVHLFSTYEARRAADDPEPFLRGINSIQLLWHDGRWWVLTVLWQHESAEAPISPEFLPQE